MHPELDTIKLKTIIETIENYPQEYLPSPYAAKLIGLKKSTLANKINLNLLPNTKSDDIIKGKPHLISKKYMVYITRLNAALINDLATSPMIQKRFKIIRQSLQHILKQNNLPYFKDILGVIRLPQETVNYIEDLLPIYKQKTTINVNGNKYYSLSYTAKEMARYSNPKQKDRIIKTLYNWYVKNKLDYVIIKNKPYLTEHQLYELIGTIRIKDASELAGVTRRTIYNWIEESNGSFLTKNPSSYKTISYDKLTEFSYYQFYKELSLMLSKKGMTKEINELSDLNSRIWSTISKQNKNKQKILNKICPSRKTDLAVKYVMNQRRQGFINPSLKSLNEEVMENTELIDLIPSPSVT